jgi:RNA polymerase sigma factor (sigma-70 family)
MKAQATPPQWHTRPNMAADLANVRTTTTTTTTTTTVGAAPPKGGKPTDGQVADSLRGYAERRDPSDRERIILAHLDLADRLAARYRDRPNTTPDDLRQTARVGLIGAVDRYDPTRGTPFLPYAIASIIGELKRYLRDATWSVRVPRTMKQHVMELLRVRDGLACGGGRWPPVAELANCLGLTYDEVTRAMQAAENRTALSLDVPGRQRGHDAPGCPAARSRAHGGARGPAGAARTDRLPARRRANRRGLALLQGPQAARDRGGDRLLADGGVPSAAPGARAPA